MGRRLYHLRCPICGEKGTVDVDLQGNTGVLCEDTLRCGVFTVIPRRAPTDEERGVSHRAPSAVTPRAHPVGNYITPRRWKGKRASA